MTHYNTTNETGAKLAKLGKKANSQNNIILPLFAEHGFLTAGTTQDILEDMGITWPIWSTRRAITNLANSHYLRRTEKKLTSTYGRPEHIYEYAR